jgi:hypothetical protein
MLSSDPLSYVNQRIFRSTKAGFRASPLAPEPKNPLDLSQKLATQEKEMIEAALRESDGRVSGLRVEDSLTEDQPEPLQGLAAESPLTEVLLGIGSSPQ